MAVRPLATSPGAREATSSLGRSATATNFETTSSSGPSGPAPGFRPRPWLAPSSHQRGPR
eukprot:11154329-Lingulodinium_polyedra.AAC.1